MKTKLSKLNKIGALLALLTIGGLGLGFGLQNHNTKENNPAKTYPYTVVLARNFYNSSSSFHYNEKIFYTDILGQSKSLYIAPQFETTSYASSSRIYVKNDTEISVDWSYPNLNHYTTAGITHPFYTVTGNNQIITSTFFSNPYTYGVKIAKVTWGLATNSMSVNGYQNLINPKTPPTKKADLKQTTKLMNNWLNDHYARTTFDAGLGKILGDYQSFYWINGPNNTRTVFNLLGFYQTIYNAQNKTYGYILNYQVTAQGQTYPTVYYWYIVPSVNSINFSPSLDKVFIAK